MKGVSKELKSAMSEVKEILKKYDIAGSVFLADGKGNGEFANFFALPTWSMLRFIDRGEKGMAVHIKSYNKTKKEESNRTINSLYNIHGMMGHIYMVIDKVINDIEKRIDIAKEEGEIIPFNEQQ